MLQAKPLEHGVSQAASHAKMSPVRGKVYHMPRHVAAIYRMLPKVLRKVQKTMSARYECREVSVQSLHHCNTASTLLPP